jgi:U3 small nucleolar RNA-associated protein 3
MGKGRLYAIEKNKGWRQSERRIRNRVKKRKYEEKKKKLGSVRQVYKGGEEEVDMENRHQKEW